MELPIVVGQVVAQKYRVDRFIGQGGMGVVVAGFHLELDQPVAIKFLVSESGLQSEGAERFRREARAAAKIQSEHVARVFDVGLLDERVPYMVMELLDGSDLEHEIERRGALPVAEAVGYLLQAIDAVAEAHAVGIVHRDLKPTNLFLAQRADGSRIVKVLDFGISKSLGSGRQREVALTRTAAFIGSPVVHVARADALRARRRRARRRLGAGRDLVRHGDRSVAASRQLAAGGLLGGDEHDAAATEGLRRGRARTRSNRS